MSIRRPLASLARIHPEHIATVARDANRCGRFFMAFDGTIERSVEGWAPYESERRAWRDERILTKAFDPGFRPILAAMRGCRIFGLTPKLLTTTPNAPLAWLERCTVRAGHALDVVLDANGARDDVGVWWWLCVHASPVISCDAGALDAATLFTIGDGVHFASTRFLPRNVIAHAKSEGSRPGMVALAPGGSEHGWGMLLVAEEPVIGELAAQAVRSFPAEEKQVHVHETLDTSILSAIESSTYWTGNIDAEHFERRIVGTLKRGAKHPEIPRDAIRALAAAEGIAIAEGRGPAIPAEGMAHLVAGFAREHAEKADPVSDETIELALRTVQLVRDAASWERREYISEEGRSAFRAELDGLRKRLLTAQSTRRVRARAPNAVRLSALRQIPLIPINWREISLHMMQEDALAFVSALRDETGAVTSVPMSDLTLRAMPFDWDAREVLETIMGEPFDERIADDPSRLMTGLPVFVWWPDVSPAPDIREAIDGWESVGWGFAQITLRGATADRVLRSTWQYPTGTELRESKFADAGPWRDVAWPLLKKKVAAVKELIRGPLGGIASRERDVWTLAAAATEAREGPRLLD
ncbi:MAG TPA: hypothetical protein VJT85_05285 [Gemmatimonadaceae bacterium]|nr:hypothetical protein [Gemmatimonadaceae bacterium]